MRKFKRWLRNWLEDSNKIEVESNYPISIRRGGVGRANPSISSDSEYGSVTFRVVAARGGKVIEANRWDNKNDRETTTLYVVPDTEDLTQSIGKIITMESMR